MVKEIQAYFEEHKGKSKYIFQLALSSAKSDTKNTTLGIYWYVVRDLVFFIAYGFFMMVIRGRSGDVEGIPVMVYLYTGLAAWYLIADYLNSGVKCMTNNKKIFTKIKFPILIIPTYETIAIFIRRIISFVLITLILVVFMLISDYRVDINFFGLFYALFASFIFGVSYILFMSSFYTISKDFRQLYMAITRIQFYFVPIFWSTQEMARFETVNKYFPGLGDILEYFPFIHLVNSFRRAISLHEFPPIQHILVFLGVVLFLFLVGVYIQYRMRRIYADFV